MSNYMGDRDDLQSVVPKLRQPNAAQETANLLAALAAKAVCEGDEWTDGMFNYIAYRKSDGRMVIRDPEGFDYEDVAAFLAVDLDATLEPVDVSLEGAVKIARWEGECEVLPRD